MPLTLLDRIAVAMHGETRRLDFTFVMHFPGGIEPGDLTEGARSAQLEYPTSGAVLDGLAWRPGGDFMRPIVVTGDAEEHAAAARFANDAWDLRAAPPVRQALLKHAKGTGALLVTSFHHAACDGTSALLWLEHQLGVVRGLRPARTEAAARTIPVLRRHPAPARRSAFAYRLPCHGVSTNGAPASGQRAWRTTCVARRPFDEAVRDAGGFTYNDLLAACALDALRAWNDRGARRRLGLWLPVNAREEHGQGFGNGSSRIRVYDRAPRGSTLIEQARWIRRQVEWSRAHGEWAVPATSWLHRLPERVARPILRAYFQRPWADMGTAPFSHLERSALASPAFDGVAAIELVGPLDPRHAVGLFLVTRGNDTQLTFVRDPVRVEAHTMDALITGFHERLDAALAGAIT